MKTGLLHPVSPNGYIRLLSDNHGILVQNCYVEDGQGNRILIIDQDGFVRRGGERGDPCFYFNINGRYKGDEE